MSLPFLALKLGDKMVQYSVHAFSVVVQQLQKCPLPSTFLQQKTENLERHTERKRIRGYFWTRYVALLELMAPFSTTLCYRVCQQVRDEKITNSKSDFFSLKMSHSSF